MADGKYSYHGRREPANWFTCEWCSKEAHRSRSSTNVAKGYSNRWCSLACRKAQAADARSRAAQGETHRRAVMSVARSLSKLARARSTIGKPVLTYTCQQCQVSFLSSRHGLMYCSVRCSRIAWRKTPNGRKAKKAHRKADKMRRRGVVVEIFSDTEILERDGWRCQICGIRTPKSMRGKYKPNAPEIDHVIAVANGGAHSRTNVQCSCRACNARKRDGPPLGQVRLL